MGQIEKLKPRFGSISGQVMPPEPKFSEQGREPSERHAGHHSWRLAFIVLFVMAFVYGPLCFAAGWMSYDQSVKSTSDTLQDMAIKSDIARRIAEGSTR